MRLWSINPHFLDTAGLTAAWREGLGARTSLRKRLDARAAGKTPAGYAAHPQLTRFEAHADPLAALDAWLHGVCDEADARGYKYNRGKLAPRVDVAPMPVTRGQLGFEADHLLKKLADRHRVDRSAWGTLHGAIARGEVTAHGLSTVVDGGIEAWERGAD